MAALVDTNILVYRFDPASPRKQAAATELLRRGIAEDSLRIPHQAIVEFIPAVTRPRTGGTVLMSRRDACLEAEQMLDQFVVLYPKRVPGSHRGARRGSLSTLMVSRSPLGIRGALRSF